MSKHAGWFEILTVARGFESPFTSAELGSAAGLVKTKKSSVVQIAGAWLGKFAKWGYAQRGDVIKQEKGKSIITWTLTEKGHTCRLQESLESRFARLLAVVREYQDALGQGTRAETEALTKLRDVADKVDLSKATEE
jgi:hypothetical protein